MPLTLPPLNIGAICEINIMPFDTEYLNADKYIGYIS